MEPNSITDIYSPTSLKEFLYCPMKYKLKYIDGLYGTRTNDKSSYMGMVYHNFLKHYYRALYEGKTYKVFTNDLIYQIIDEISLHNVTNLPKTEISSLKSYLFNDIIVSYLARKPNRVAKVYQNVPMLEYEIKNVPIIHPLTEEVIVNAELQCKFDFITNLDEIIEFKLPNRSYDSFKLKRNLQTLIQTYIFKQTFGYMPEAVYLEMMVREYTKPILELKQLSYNDNDFIQLFELINAINIMKLNSSWYRSYPQNCRECQFMGDTCNG